MIARIALLSIAISTPALADCPTGCDAVGGDVNGDGSVDISDFSSLAGWFSGTVDAVCEETADVNGDGAVDISDLVYLSDYLFDGGDAPVDPVCDTCPATCEDVVAGDVNGDGDLDIADIAAFSHWMWGGGEDICLRAADVNQDGAVDITDYSLVYRYLFASGARLVGPDCE